MTTDLSELTPAPTAAPAPTEPATAPPEAEPAALRWQPLLRPVRYYLASRLLVLGAAIVAGLLYPSLNVVRSLGSVWDGRWYLLIAQHGYPQRMYQEGLGSRWAFFRLFPP